MKQLNEQTEEDAKSRLRALDPGSFIVEAPAGAGKTELLTQRFLKLLAGVQAPEEIIAITFTKKAAAEMRLRILGGLMMAARREQPAELHKQTTYELSLQALQHAENMQWRLLENPSRLRILTIDGLCAHLVKQMPLMSRFGKQPRITEDDAEALYLYRQAAEQTLALLENAEHGEVIKAALRYIDNDADRLAELLVKMLEKRDQWLHHAQHEVSAEQLQKTLSYMVEQALQVLVDALPIGLQQALMPIARFAASNLPDDDPVALLRDWQTPLATDASALPMWRAVIGLLLTDKGDLRKEGGLKVTQGFPANEAGRPYKRALGEILATMTEGKVSILNQVRHLPHLTQQEDDWRMIVTLSKLLNLAVAKLWLVFQSAGEVDFVEIIQRSIQALSDEFGEPTDLALKLDYQIKHLLVDEFQDTSPSQITLLERLTLGWQADDGRTLFAVGDPMQSIYRFRKANVGLFIHASAHGIGDIRLERLQLYQNNRSCPAVVAWINRAFQKVFSERDNFSKEAVCYRPFIATKPDDAQAGVSVHPIVKQTDEEKDSVSTREAEVMVEIIRKTQAEQPQASIAVLVRSRKHLSALVTKLRREHKGIPFQAVEIEALAGRQVVQDLLALTHALHHRADRVHWLAVLRAPWCGLTLHDLHTLAGSERQRTIWSLLNDEETIKQLSEDGQTRLQHVRDIFEQAFATQGRMSLSRWVRGVWLALNGAACLWEQSDVVDVQAFFACMDELDRSNRFSPELMESEITRLFAAPDSEGERLQMMTIHKSKGLEFDCVILPGLGAGIRDDNSKPPLLLWEEVVVETAHGQHSELLAAPYLPKSLRDDNVVSPYDYLKALEKERGANEDARVLYVAATRAKHQLHLTGVASRKENGDITPAKNSCLALLWHELEPYYAGLDDNVIAADDEGENELANFTPQLVRLKQLQVPPVLAVQKAEMPVKTGVVPKAAQSASIKSASIEADIGTLAHRYLELIARQGLSNWSAERVASLAPAMRYWLAQQGHAAPSAAEAATVVQGLLNTTLNSTAGQWVLQARDTHDAELAITSSQNRDKKAYVVDRTFVEDGVRWVVDYKSVALDDGADAEQIKATALKFQEQLDSYVALFADEGLPIKKAVLLLRAGQLVEI